MKAATDADRSRKEQAAKAVAVKAAEDARRAFWPLCTKFPVFFCLFLSTTEYYFFGLFYSSLIILSLSLFFSPTCMLGLCPFDFFY